MTTAVAAPQLDAYRTTGPSPTPIEDRIVALPRLALERGSVLEAGRIAVRTAGPADAPTVLVLGGISAGRAVVAAPGEETAGWWEAVVRPGRGIDTSRYRVLSIDWLGGRGDSTPAGELPRTPPAEPQITPRDQAAAIVGALDALGIGRLHACAGSSYGGMVALALASQSPERVARLAVLGAAHEPHPMATALRGLQREIVRLGVARGDPREGLILARGLAMTTYRSAREFALRFADGPGEPDGSRRGVAGYLRARGERFADAFTPDAFLCLSQSIDLHRVDPASIRTPVTLVAFEPDAIAPAWQIRALADQLPGPWVLRTVRSQYGHDAFLREPTIVGAILSDVLSTREAC